MAPNDILRIIEQRERFLLRNPRGSGNPDGQKESPSSDSNSTYMTFGQFTESKLLIPHLHSSRSDGAIRELAKSLETTGRIGNPTAFLEAVLQREEEMPTFLESVAIPHARGAAVNKLSVAVGLSVPGIPWGRDGRHIAKIVFLFAVPLSEARTYLSMLSGLSTLIHDEMACAALKHATQPEAMLGVLQTVRLVPLLAQPNQAPMP